MFDLPEGTKPADYESCLLITGIPAAPESTVTTFKMNIINQIFSLRKNGETVIVTPLDFEVPVENGRLVGIAIARLASAVECRDVAIHATGKKLSLKRKNKPDAVYDILVEPLSVFLNKVAQAAAPKPTAPAALPEYYGGLNTLYSALDARYEAPQIFVNGKREGGDSYLGVATFDQYVHALPFTVSSQSVDDIDFYSVDDACKAGVWSPKGTYLCTMEPNALVLRYGEFDYDQIRRVTIPNVAPIATGFSPCERFFAALLIHNGEQCTAIYHVETGKQLTLTKFESVKIAGDQNLGVPDFVKSITSRVRFSATGNYAAIADSFDNEISLWRLDVTPTGPVATPMPKIKVGDKNTVIKDCSWAPGSLDVFCVHFQHSASAEGRSDDRVNFYVPARVRGGYEMHQTFAHTVLSTSDKIVNRDRTNVRISWQADGLFVGILADYFDTYTPETQAGRSGGKRMAGAVGQTVDAVPFSRQKLHVIRVSSLLPDAKTGTALAPETHAILFSDSPDENEIKKNCCEDRSMVSAFEFEPSANGELIALQVTVHPAATLGEPDRSPAVTRTVFVRMSRGTTPTVHHQFDLPTCQIAWAPTGRRLALLLNKERVYMYDTKLLEILNCTTAVDVTMESVVKFGAKVAWDPTGRFCMIQSENSDKFAIFDFCGHRLCPEDDTCCTVAALLWRPLPAAFVREDRRYDAETRAIIVEENKQRSQAAQVYYETHMKPRVERFYRVIAEIAQNIEITPREEAKVVEVEDMQRLFGIRKAN